MRMLQSVLKVKFSMSYKEIPDEKFQQVIDYIDYLVENPRNYLLIY